MDRQNDITLDPRPAWLEDSNALAVCGSLEDAGFAALFVGGCVRNAVMGGPATDVDIATDALPDQIIETCSAAGLKCVPTGLDHGTITVVSGGHPFEVTTYRRDVETDGRRAVVSFSKDVADDARRRDFTINALYCTLKGKVIDPLGGLPDALARRVRFIDDPVARIKEDYLRILRFFRFTAWYGDPALGFDADALNAIASNLDGLDRLSAERVGHEIIKLLAAPDPTAAIAVMRQTGVLAHVLPAADDQLLGPLVHVELAANLPPDACRRLASLGGDDVTARLRLSNADGRRVEAIKVHCFGPDTPAALGYRHGTDIAQSSMALRAAFENRTLKDGELAEIAIGASAQFPVQAKDLMPGFQGPALGAKLKQLEDDWIASGFTKTRDQLLG